MNRANLIAKAQRVLAEYDGLAPLVRTRMAELVVDAVLPQITTVEQLRALPLETLVIADGVVFCADEEAEQRIWRVMDPDAQQWTTSQLLLEVDGPLTVVWQPS